MTIPLSFLLPVSVSMAFPPVRTFDSDNAYEFWASGQIMKKMMRAKMMKINVSDIVAPPFQIFSILPLMRTLGHP